MAAVPVEVELEHGIDEFHCRACGSVVFSPAVGFKENCCKHLRVFVDRAEGCGSPKLRPVVNKTKVWWRDVPSLAPDIQRITASI